MNRKPDVIRSVFAFDVGTPFRVRLGEPPVVCVSLHLFDTGAPLAFEISLDESLEPGRILQKFGRARGFVRPDRKERERLDARRLGKLVAVEVAPWDIRIACRFLMGPEHAETRPAIDGRIDHLVPWPLSEARDDF